jgi:hypothetical protein
MQKQGCPGHEGCAEGRIGRGWARAKFAAAMPGLEGEPMAGLSQPRLLLVLRAPPTWGPAGPGCDLDGNSALKE